MGHNRVFGQTGRRTFIGAVIAATLTVAACGSSTTSSASGGNASTGTGATSSSTSSNDSTGSSGTGTANACGLVTQNEASAALGTSVPAGTSSQNGATCSYIGPYGLVAIHIATAATVQGGNPNAALQALSRQHSAQPVSGIGDSAIVFTTTGGGVSAVFVKKNALIVIGASDSNGSTVSQDAVITLARRAADRY